ncbi:MAG: proprotein convertase P-domain-containing protein, partial [Bacteroidota bacterium]
MKKITLLFMALFMSGLAFAQPANDMCMDAITLTGDGVVSGTTVGAAVEGVPFCGTSSTSPGVYYTFTDGSGTGSMVTLSLCGGATFDTKIGAFTGTCGALVCETGLDDFCGLQSEISFMTDGSSTYYVLVHGFGGASGPFDLTVSGLPAAPGPAPIGECGVGLPAAFDPPNTVISAATVSDTGVIGTDYTLDNVEIDIQSNWPNDVSISLESPAGTTLDLSSNNGGGADPIDAVIQFTDASANDVTAWTGGAPAADYQPEGGLFNTVFAGESVTGDWTFTLNDAGFGDGGTLRSYCINFAPIVGDPPVISCPANIAASTDPGACGAVVNYAPAVAIDPDGDLDTVVQISPDPMVLGSGDEFPVGTTTVTFRATDLAGNFSECSFDIVVTDDEDPTITCSDLTVELDAAGMATVVPGDVAMADDNCPGVVMEFGGAGTPGSLTTTFANNNGQSGNMFDIVALNDITINSFDINMDTGVTDVAEVYFKTGPYLPSIGTPGDWTLVASTSVTSAGEGVPTPLNLNLGIAVPAGNQVAFYVTLTTTTAINYTNGSTTGALFASDANLEFYEGAGLPYPFSGNFNPRVFNGNIIYETGGVPTPSLDFTCADVGVNVVTVTATDASGNTASCTTNITVEDNIAPVIACIGEPATITDSATSSPGTAITDNATFTDVITVTDDQTITDLNVDLDINHTWTGDLIVTLESPAGTQAVIFDGNADGCSANDLVVLLDDESANPLDCDPSGTGTGGDAFPLGDYMPSNPLSVFDGESSLGDWTLSIEDDAGGDQGTWNSWTVSYSYDLVATPLEVDLDAMGNATINASDLLLSVDEACGWTATVGGTTTASLETTFVGGNGFEGNMFDINAINEVTINSFDVNLDNGVVDDVEVWAKVGTYVGSESTMADWTLIGTAAGITSAGDGLPTPLNLSLGYTIPAGELHAFYVTTVNGGGMNYTNGTAVGDVFASDANIEFLEGAGGGYFSVTFSPRVFNGNIYYEANTASTTIDFTCEDLGENLIEVTVTDDSGNVSTCMATVNVNDVTDPILICMDVTIELGPDGTAVV